MPDVNLTVGLIPEVPKNLDSVRDAFRRAVSDGIKLGSATGAYVRGVASEVKALKQVEVTAENYKDLLQAGLVTRTFANNAAAYARSYGTPTALTIAVSNQEAINKVIREARGFPERERRNQEKAEKERVAESKAAAKEKSLQEDFAYFDAAYATAYSDVQNATEVRDIRDAIQRMRLAGSARTAAAKHVYDTRDVAALKDSTLLDLQESNEKLRKAMDNNTDIVTKWVGTYKNAVAAGGAGIAAGNYLSNIMRSYYGNRRDPRTEFWGKIDDLVQYGGGAAGAGIGGAIGSLGGPVGMAVGAVLGGLTGSVTGGWWNRTRSAAISTQEDAIEQMRWALKYGNTGIGWQYARLAEKTGFVGMEDMESLKTASQTFGPSVALGQVSADQWLALYHLPNTLAALSSGADEATLLQAMQSDAGMYSAGWAQKWFQMAGFSDNLRVLATSGMLESVNRDIPSAERMASELGALIAAIVPAFYDRGYKDLISRRTTWRKVATEAGSEYFNTVGPTVVRTLGGERSVEDIRTIASLQEDIAAGRDPSRLTPLEININLNDDNVLRLQNVYTDDTSLTDKIQYTAGSTL